MCDNQLLEYLGIGLGLFLGLSLPISIYFELKNHKWARYLQMYPHLILYPAFFYWPILNISAKLVCLVKKEEWSDLYLWFTAAIAFSFYALSIELKSEQMMLFEIKPEAEITLNRNELANSIVEFVENTPSNKIIIDEQIIKNIQEKNDSFTYSLATFHSNMINFLLPAQDLPSDEKNLPPGEKEWVSFILSYPTTWKHNKNQLSFSRLIYQVLYFVLTLNLLTTAIFLGYYGYTYVTQGRNLTALIYSLVCALYFIIWIPFRLYNQKRIKILIFPQKDSTKEKPEEEKPKAFKPNLEFIQAGVLDIFVYLALLGGLVLLLFLLDKISWLLIALPLIILITLVAILINSKWLERIFGLKSSPTTWFILFPLLGLLNWFVLNILPPL